MIVKEIKTKIVLTLSIILLISGICTFILSINNQFNLIKYPYQHEYREGAGLTLTKSFCDGKNPYALENQPQNTYVYGVLYPLITLPFAKIFGATLIVHRIISFIFILLSAILTFFVLRFKKTNILFSFIGGLISFQVLLYSGCSLAHPEALGIFLYLLSLIIPWRFNYSYKSLIISVLFGLSAFLTKPYFVLGMIYLPVYIFLFVNKKKSFIFFTFSAFIFIIFLYFINLFFPLYINDCIFHHNNVASFNISHMFNQLISFSRKNISFILILTVILFIPVFSKNVKKIDLPEFYSIKDFDKPLFYIKNDCLFLLSIILTLFLFIFKLGGHTGSGNALYLYHLISILIIIFTIFVINDYYDFIYIKIFVLIVLLAGLLISFRSMYYKYENNRKDFDELKKEITLNKEILNSPEVVSILIEQNKPIYNSGQSEYFASGANSLSIELGFSKNVINRNNQYIAGIKNNIINKKYNIILLTEGYYSFFIEKNVLKDNYFLKRKINAPMIYSLTEIEVWYPIEKHLE
jgi:hypothetical protein